MFENKVTTRQICVTEPNEAVELQNALSHISSLASQTITLERTVWPRPIDKAQSKGWNQRLSFKLPLHATS